MYFKYNNQRPTIKNPLNALQGSESTSHAPPLQSDVDMSCRSRY